MIRLVLADDHTVVRAGLRAMLEEVDDLQVAGEATTGAEILDLVERLQPHVILMDLRMPEMDGVAATARITRERPGIHVLVLTTYDTDADIVRAIEAGATGYLLKDATRDRLLEAVRAAAAGDSVLAPRIASRLMERMRARDDETLSAREIEVLELVASGHANKEIARALYVSEATVKTHLVHAFGKLGVDDRTQAVTAALQRGIIRLDS